MPWRIGIDEAGYGPNLGPLVMTVTACRTESEEPSVWKLLRGAVRKPGTREDARLVVGDSKEVYSTAKGLAALEASVLSYLRASEEPSAAALATLRCLLKRVCPGALEELTRDPWQPLDITVPTILSDEEVHDGAEKWRAASAKNGVHWGLVRSVLVGAERFNAIVDRHGSKAAVLGLGWTELVQAALGLPGDDPLHFVVDKHGGRNVYGVMVQHAFGDGMVLAREEGAERSVYEVLGMSRQIRVTFRPRADSACFNVALASMVSKYLREICMMEFNQFWQTKVSDLKPTAGYPSDSHRFLRDLGDAPATLNISRERLWRCR